jgi:hypothetical protein
MAYLTTQGTHNGALLHSPGLHTMICRRAQRHQWAVRSSWTLRLPLLTGSMHTCTPHTSNCLWLEQPCMHGLPTTYDWNSHGSLHAHRLDTSSTTACPTTDTDTTHATPPRGAAHWRTRHGHLSWFILTIMSWLNHWKCILYVLLRWAAYTLVSLVTAVYEQMENMAKLVQEHLLAILTWKEQEAR